MRRYKPTAIKPYKTHRGCAQVPCYLGLRSAIITLFTTGLVKIQTNTGSLPRCSKRLVLRESRGEEAGPPGQHPARTGAGGGEGEGAAAAARCQPVVRAEGSIASFTAFQGRKSHLESDQKIYFTRNEAILSGLDSMDVCICHL